MLFHSLMNTLLQVKIISYDINMLNTTILSLESKLNLREISSYVRKAADFMESSAVTAVKLNQEFNG